MIKQIIQDSQVTQRYEHNVPKCAVVTYPLHIKSPQLYLGKLQIPQVATTTHMGVPLGKVNDDVINEIINKGKRCFFSLLGLSRSGTIMDPSIASRLYWTVVIPVMLHGVELLPLTPSQVDKLDSAHIQMAKVLQGLPDYTPNAGTLCQIGWISISSFLRRKSMLLLYKLLHLPGSTTAKQVVVTRLTQLRHSPDDSNSPISLMYRHYRAYGLADMVHRVLDTGVIPCYNLWKKQVQTAVMSAEGNRQIVSRLLHPSLKIYNMAIGGIQLCQWWRLAVSSPMTREKCRCTISFICSYDARYRNGRCQFCLSYENDTVEHLVMHCGYFMEWRASLALDIAAVCDDLSHHRSVGLASIFSGGCNSNELKVIVEALCYMSCHIHHLKSARPPSNES